jgi:hypothetical protein
MMVAKNAKFKDGVYGFIWEQDGTVGEIFTEPLSDKDIQLIYKVIDEDHMLIVDDEDFLNCFCDGDPDDWCLSEKDYYGCQLDKVVELV